ncbi:MAG: hypothetical protein KBC73_18850 [Burkholderiaceae bacterium]|nr:hypothetical protein [Burkholderiaceae bacterium]
MPLIVALTACATVTGGGREQEVRVVVVDGSSALLGADCVLRNGRGQWSLKAPGYVTVGTHVSDLVLRCEHGGMAAVEARFQASARTATAGNAIVGGLAGATVDVASGAAFRYPPVLLVVGTAVGTPASELQAVAALRSPQEGDELEYRVLDRYTGLVRQLSSRITQVGNQEVVRDQGRWRRTAKGVERAADALPSLGDLDGMEPAAGWLPPGAQALRPGHAWSGTHQGRDAQGRYRFDWRARVLRQELLAVPSGAFLATVLRYTGVVHRETLPSVFIAQTANLELWVEPGSRAVLRMVSEVKPSGGGSQDSGGRVSDVYELASVRRGGADVRGSPGRATWVADPQLPWTDLVQEWPALPHWLPNARWQYRLVDRYTGLSRHEAVVLSRSPQNDWLIDGGRRIVAADRVTVKQHATSPRLGDYEMLEPPSGWFPVYLEAGMRWSTSFTAHDGLRASAVQLEAEVLGQELLHSALGSILTWKVRFTGTAMRDASSASVPMPHRVVFEVWRELRGPQVLRFSSDIRPDNGLAGMSSRELIELVGLDSGP